MSTSYKTLSNIFLARLIPHADKITEDTTVDFEVTSRVIRFPLSGRY
jgi:hypothetical protein